MTLREETQNITSALTPKYGAGEARTMASIIFENLKGWSAVDMALKANEEISEFIHNKIAQTIKRLLADEPIQYIFGNAHFCGMKFKVTTDTLIPRPETAELVDLIDKENQQKDLRVLDLGTGSGCIAIALSRFLPYSIVTAVDISAKALAIAKENANHLHAHIRFIECDMLDYEALEHAMPSDKFDIIVSNPPYIALQEKECMDANVLNFEPSSALFVPDSQPAIFYDAIARFASNHLNEKGKIYAEINPLFTTDTDQAFRKHGFHDIKFVKDFSGKNRFIIVSK